VTSASLDTSYAFGRKITVTAGAGWGHTRFLGEGGRVVLHPGPPVELGGQRQDTYVNWSTGLSYNFHEHLKLSANYNWFQNWSSNSFSDFVRRSWGFSATSRW
jgi:outer membrane receptor protein involved in Fe transport